MRNQAFELLPYRIDQKPTLISINIGLDRPGDETYARLLTSAAEVEEAVQNGDLTLEEPGVVVNMSMVTWPGGRR